MRESWRCFVGFWTFSLSESGFVPFLIQLKLPDSELADGKTEYSTSDSLLSSFAVLPRCELLATNSATKNYEIQKCLKLKLYSIRSLNFSCLSQNSLKLTWINLVLPHTDIGQKNFGRLRAKELHMKNGVSVFIVYKNFEVSAKILSHGLSHSFPRDWLDQVPKFTFQKRLPCDEQLFSSEESAFGSSICQKCDFEFSAHLLPESIHILLWLNCYTIGPCIIWVVQSSLWVLANLSQQLVLWS